MRRFACTVLFTCGLLICLAAQSHAYYQGKTKESSQAGAAEDATKSKSQTAPATPAKTTVKPATRPAPTPKVNVTAPRVGVKTPQIGVTSPQIGVKAPQIGVTAPQIGVTAPQVRGTSPQIGGTAQPLPRGTRGTGYDQYDGVPRGAGMGVYVPMPVPPREAEDAPPAYGNVPAPAPSAPAAAGIPAYDAGDAKPKDPAAGEFAMPVPTAAKDDAGAPRTPPPAGAAPPPALLPAQLSGRFAGIQGRTMHTWEFRPDGTFEHAWTASGGNAVVEAGTYSVMGPYLTLAVWGRAASASAPPARGSQQQVRRHRLGMLGPGAGNAIMLDGLMLKPQD